MAFGSIKELLEINRKTHSQLWQIIMEEDAHDRNVSTEDSFEKMRNMWRAMKASSDNYDPSLRSSTGLSGGDSSKMKEYGDRCISGEFMGEVIAEAIGMAESNACMRCVVAAPTAGSCGVIPAVLIPYVKKYNINEEKIVKGLFVSAGFGSIIAERAFIAGAMGGCQAEIGSASEMTAAMLVYLHGGSPKQSASALAFALKSLLEVPCVKRNVIGAVNAIVSADMALAGIETKIPADEVIDAMREVGLAMPQSLKETSEGGLAATPSGIAIAEKIPKLGSYAR